ncbi:unnamed protein product, partial [Meganyctiphanes norvegica]
MSASPCLLVATKLRNIARLFRKKIKFRRGTEILAERLDIARLFRKKTKKQLILKKKKICKFWHQVKTCKLFRKLIKPNEKDFTATILKKIVVVSVANNVWYEHDKCESPLHTACVEGHLPVVQKLLAAGANKNLKKSDGVTPLYAACLKGHLPIVEDLLLNTADCDIVDSNGCEITNSSMNYGNLTIINSL